jgi:hypothetical protein
LADGIDVHLHLPAAFVVALFAVALAGLVVFGLPVGLTVRVGIQVQVRIPPGTSVDVLVLQLHVTLARLCIDPKHWRL